MNRRYLILAMLLALVSSCTGSGQRQGPDKGETWRALHVLNYKTDKALEKFSLKIPELAEKGINVLILEVDYNFDFKSHPELRMKQYITKEGARKFAAVCRENDIRLVPQFQCVGHQSWAEHTFTLLTVYPELDLTPGYDMKNEELYCREWDIMNPRVYEIVFPLIDEIMEAFEADAIHVGMDEVFLLGTEHSPTTKGMNTAELYAKAVNDIYAHLVTARGWEMLMWADRFIDGEKIDLGKWESSENGMAPAIDMVPKDIVMCPWHYSKRDSYESLPVFLEKGFRILPSSWHDVEAGKALITYSLGLDNSAMLGHLFTTWGRGRDDIANYPPVKENIGLLKD